ncbi:MAG: hypothetical protein K6T73_03005 [Candidatus Bathyarchaeota archaeon]|nr:hypothetical protein [Candidatus Bathyarchaeota archaeon]
MVKSPVGKEASTSDKAHIIKILENVGRALQPLELAQIINSLPKDVVLDKEKLTRFLLLTAFLDQQAESPSARRTAIKIYNVFGDYLFFEPQQCLMQINKLAALKDEYKISPAIGRVLPRFGWFVLRVGGFLTYEMMLDKTSLSEKLGQCKSLGEATAFLQSNPVVESILREKATRMYVSWIGHPDLGIDVSNGKWNKSFFEMPVDGHVGKIFSRAGLVSEVIHEEKEGSGSRWNVIVASKMRPSIQEATNQHGEDCIMVDHGAFQIGINCCPDNLEGIACDSCPRASFCQIKAKIGCKGYCMLRDYCKRNVTWRAY